MNSKGISKTRKEILKLVLSAIFAALAIVVGLLEIVWPPAPWLKLDFSEVVILVSLLLLGFNHTFFVIIVRSVVRWLTSSGNTDIPFPFFGETIAIITSLSVVLVYMLARHITRNYDYPRIKNHKKGKRSIYKVSQEGEPEASPSKAWLATTDIVKIVFTTIIMAIIMIILNFFIVTPSFASQGAHPFVTSFVRSGQYHQFGADSYSGFLWFVTSLYGPFNLVKFLINMTIFTIIKYPLMKAIDIR